VAYVGAEAMFGTSSPRETEVSDCAAERDRQTEIDVERHADEHQTKTEPQLDEV